ncbi:N-acetylmuramic acid 6-phosphate etherase [Rhodocaloribacter litoris]|uniref:N-acetylmuramic acid 6-phosphate etherase n=1 Tax=Rhodocaloribacter litoris TaxID=2558931 RepID=UPI0014226AF7|nr:N-acetylmuramic acid 6-phosphate etherase [Rhodocaloribacter litoris]QXD13720.1 N-acetylmuramic acid 6-phosphate etherase [Rhodocaloribacter litoris]GIV61037.1 MAG: N-acetylmuramic acid 6-phosphate etherase [Rhodothermaceae bacterium]
MSTSPLFEQLKALATEQRNPHSRHIDLAPVREILEVINTEDHLVPVAVRREIPYIEQAVHLVVSAFRRGGRLLYVGAGTSGRLGVLDAAECPPTYGTPPEMVQGLIAGGREAMFRAQEGAEDREEDGARDLEAFGLRAEDVVCGIAASRRTPYVVGAVRYARGQGCKTLFVTCTPRSEFNLEVDVAICPVVGPEVVMGSTRMKSGTAQKLVLNMITTAAMVRLGKVYENMMVDLQMTNLKLVERSKRTVMMVTGVDYAEAERVLKAAGGHVKTALVMILAGVDAREARQRLERAGGFVRPAIAGEAYDPGA